MKALVFTGDSSGCFHYRCRIPFAELKRFGVETTFLLEIPNNTKNTGVADFAELCRFINQYDLIVLQRCYKYAIFKPIKDACEFVGKKLIFETDDYYLHIPKSNACSKELEKPGVKEDYIKIISQADLVTVSTQELKDILYLYNKNIEVLPNNVEQVSCGFSGKPFRAYTPIRLEDGKITLNQVQSFVQVPTHNLTKERIIRVGYSGTPTHDEDFATIQYNLERVCKEYKNKIWLIFIGSDYFYKQMPKDLGVMMHIPVSTYHSYMSHLRNLDIGLAPIAPNLFNMSKSPIKAIEYASWGTPAVLPNYITYKREFTHRENCLMYRNGGEFEELLSELIEDNMLREKLGTNARDYVLNNRLESLHAERRYQVYKKIVDSQKPPKRFLVA